MDGGTRRGLSRARCGHVEETGMKFVVWKVRPALAALVLGVMLGATALASAATCSPTWNEIPASGPASGLKALSALSPRDAWALSGSPGPQGQVQHWDGTSWSVVPNPIPYGMGLGDVSALAANDVWSVGGIPRADVRLMRGH
jgi:hypothetical protein